MCFGSLWGSDHRFAWATCGRFLLVHASQFRRLTLGEPHVEGGGFESSLLGAGLNLQTGVTASQVSGTTHAVLNFIILGIPDGSCRYMK